jgi:hypothetical protein
VAKRIKPKGKHKGKPVRSMPQATKRKISSKDVYEWIRTKISTRNSKTGKAICPFAKATLETEAIQVVHGKPNLVDQINHCCNLFDTLALDCVVIILQHTITESALAKLCNQAHKNNAQFAILYDHPDNKGLHKGVSFSFGKAPLIMIQRLKQLKNAQRQLQKTDYYESWGLDPNDSMFY